MKKIVLCKIIIAVSILFLSFCMIGQKSITWEDLKIEKTEKYKSKYGVDRTRPLLSKNQEELVDKKIRIEGYVIGLVAGSKTIYSLSNQQELIEGENTEQILLDLNFDSSEELEKAITKKEIIVEGVLVFNQNTITGNYFYLENVKVK